MLRTAAAYFAGLHIGVGFCVARSDGNGQCEGLTECRDGQQVQTPALFLYVAIHYLFNPTGPGSLPAKTEKQ